LSFPINFIENLGEHSLGSMLA